VLKELDWLAASPWREARRRPTGAQSTLERRRLALRWVQRCAATVTSMFMASSALAEDGYRGAPVRVVSAPDCVDATNFVAEFDPAPVNVTYMRVQHIGDAGTPELAGEVANPVTGDVGRLTGLSARPTVMRSKCPGRSLGCWRQHRMAAPRRHSSSRLPPACHGHCGERARSG